MSPFSQATEVDHGGGVGEEETEDHCGAPERLGGCQMRGNACGGRLERRTIWTLRPSRVGQLLCICDYL